MNKAYWTTPSAQLGPSVSNVGFVGNTRVVEFNSLRRQKRLNTIGLLRSGKIQRHTLASHEINTKGRLAGSRAVPHTQKRAKIIDTTMVLIPDIFESFMSREPIPNIHYETVREEALAWAIKTCNYDEEEGKRMCRGDFAYFGAITVPDVDASALRTVVDWLNWVYITNL